MLEESSLISLLDNFIQKNRESIDNNLKNLIYKDYLTGLYNRRSLIRLFDLMKSSDLLKKLTLFVMDLDEFKIINDSFGQSIGDLVLKKVSKVLTNTCKDAYIARIAGDEFIVIYENLENIEKIKSISNRILSQINEICLSEINFREISVSIGVVIDNYNKKDLNDLLIKSDLALCKAKMLGKNTSVIFEPYLEEERKLNVDMLNDLIYDIKNNRNVELYYQPQYTYNNKLMGFEALFRWNNEKYQNISIEKIIKIIENSRYFDYLNNFVIRNALKFAKKVNTRKNEVIIVSINISAKQLMDLNFKNKLLKLIKEEEVTPNTIALELTETVLLQDLNTNINKIQSLKDLGILIYLDDFGTSYSSLNYLIKLPLSRVKVDKYFISQAIKGEKYLKILKSIINICHILKLPVFAEGVENIEQLNILRNLNVDYIQGFLFAKPLPENEVLKLLN
ncbi:bifunctional diguanylate cyclase/phosphodiesterase (plasmid) [Clostridium perfringens]|uniref:putative bifunctional diguanylate cyclase/phosphodiesterase n=1 Tax=Clostridium perfringens TaxID=1502 RepID=UPI0013723F91|nr:bifunctional diguanylate cyclase/phosphodiesterase [Clostridium perfringens]QIN91099.1 bifunctional diguanylate cyclase/phosphodiesterase [Clostridium perfringens]